MPVLICQRGHVPRTTGSTGTAGEQALVTTVSHEIDDVAQRIRELARGVGWAVRLIDADEPTSRYAGDAFVALHCDGSVHASARGASVGYRTAAGRKLGAGWKAAYVRAGWPGPFRDDNYTAALAGYYGTGRASAAGNPRAVIVELGFLTNPTERAWLTSAAGVETAARAVVWAVTGTDPHEEDDMPLSDDDVKRIASAVWTYQLAWLEASAGQVLGRSYSTLTDADAQIGSDGGPTVRKEQDMVRRGVRELLERSGGQIPDGP